jgi:hypothetical protein
MYFSFFLRLGNSESWKVETAITLPVLHVCTFPARERPSQRCKAIPRRAQRLGQSARPLQIPDSEFPTFQGPSVGDWSDPSNPSFTGTTATTPKGILEVLAKGTRGEQTDTAAADALEREIKDATRKAVTLHDTLEGEAYNNGKTHDVGSRERSVFWNLCSLRW